MDTSEPKLATPTISSETRDGVAHAPRSGALQSAFAKATSDKPASAGASRIVVRSKRLSKETWARILDDYMGGATARELALKHGVAVQSIYSRMNGKGKKARWRGIGGAESYSAAPHPSPSATPSPCGGGDGAAGADRGL